jgi:hypothetical protein
MLLLLANRKSAVPIPPYLLILGSEVEGRRRKGVYEFTEVLTRVCHCTPSAFKR